MADYVVNTRPISPAHFTVGYQNKTLILFDFLSLKERM